MSHCSYQLILLVEPRGTDNLEALIPRTKDGKCRSQRLVQISASSYWGSWGILFFIQGLYSLPPS